MLRLEQAASGCNAGNLSLELIDFYLSVLLTCAHVKVHTGQVHSFPQRPEEGRRAPGNGVTDGIELPGVGAGS